MEIAALILGIVSLIPTLFPLLVQLDSAQKRRSTDGSQVPGTLWALWSSAGMLLGLYFLEVRRDLIALPVEQYLFWLLSMLCWFQQVDKASLTENSPGGLSQWFFKVLHSSERRSLFITFSALAAAEIIGLGLFSFLTGLSRTIFLAIIGLAGAILFCLALLQLPYRREMTLNSAYGAFMPISLLIQSVGSFCSLIVYSLLYTESDFVGISVFLILIFGEVGFILIQGMLRRRANTVTGTSGSAYAPVGDEATIDNDEIELEQFRVA